MKTAKEFKERLCEELLTDAQYNNLLEAMEHLSQNPIKGLRPNPKHQKWFQEHAAPHLPSKGAALGPWILSREELLSLPHLDLWQAGGSCFLQEPSALELTQHIPQLENALYLDLCAAPGAKATAIGEQLRPGSLLVANDVNPQRAQKLAALLSRQGVDASCVWSTPCWNLCQQLKGKAHFVLADAPCSSESFFAKRNEKRRDVKDFEVHRFAKMQKEILEAAYEALSPGGQLLYSTCTYNKVENEDQTRGLLQRHPDMDLCKEQRRWPHLDGVPGGYWALIQKTGSLSESPTITLEELSKFQNFPGFIRCSSITWRGDPDLYHQVMTNAAWNPSLELEDAQAHAYVRGESIPKEAASTQNQVVGLKWRGLLLGPGKQVSGRLNNLLPKTLRFA